MDVVLDIGVDAFEEDVVVVAVVVAVWEIV